MLSVPASIRLLRMARLCLLVLSLPSTVAQYEFHHQQFFADPPNIERRIFDTKALTPVQEPGNPKLKWAFASTVSAPDDPSRLQILLAKLQENLPETQRFKFEWAREYRIPNEPIDLDVRDVIHELRGNNQNKERYVLCGAIVKNQNSYGFLMRVNRKGRNPKGVVFPNIKVFHSVAPWHNQRGYVMVGETRPEALSDPVDPSVTEAAYVSVNQKLDSRCGIRLRGIEPPETHFQSFFHKVVPVSFVNSNGKQLFAAVGETTRKSGGSECNEPPLSSSVLVAVADNQCRIEWQYRYSRLPEEITYSLNEGYSIAEVTDTEGGLVISGNSREYLYGVTCSPLVINDYVLVFRLTKLGDVAWHGFYEIDDYGFGLEVIEISSIGTAVQMSTDPNYDLRVIVAGEGRSKQFTSSGNPNYSTDTFLMEIEKDTGDLLLLDVLGLDEDAENGALDPGTLDLHLTKDHHYVLVGNAKFPSDAFGKSFPYLVERYQNPDDVCFDFRTVRNKIDDDFQRKNAQWERFFVRFEKVPLEWSNAELEQKIICDKVEAPTPQPVPTIPTAIVPTPVIPANFEPTPPQGTTPSVFVPTPVIPANFEPNPPQGTTPSVFVPTPVIPANFEPNPPQGTTPSVFVPTPVIPANFEPNPPQGATPIFIQI